MKCYVIKDGEYFDSEKTPRQEVSKEMQIKIEDICVYRQVRNLYQKGNENYGDVSYQKEYKSLKPENFVLKNGKIVGYYADHFDVTNYVLFTGLEERVKISSYDFTNYGSGTGNVDRGFIEIVKCPDYDSNPLYDLPRFHSQEEYDDYIKWKD